MRRNVSCVPRWTHVSRRNARTTNPMSMDTFGAGYSSYCRMIAPNFGRSLHSVARRCFASVFAFILRTFTCFATRDSVAPMRTQFSGPRSISIRVVTIRAVRLTRNTNIFLSLNSSSEAADEGSPPHADASETDFLLFSFFYHDQRLNVIGMKHFLKLFFERLGGQIIRNLVFRPLELSAFDGVEHGS